MHEPIWQRLRANVDERDILNVFIDPNQTSLIYAATERFLYQLNPKLKKSKITLRLPPHSKINDLQFIGTNLYAATDDGLYQSQDGIKHWQRIYSSSDQAQSRCLSVLSWSEKLFLATGRGLSYLPQKQSNWYDFKGPWGNDSIEHLSQDQEFMYVSTNHSLYRVDKTDFSIDLIFTSGIAVNEEAQENDEDVEEAQRASTTIKDFQTSFDQQRLYLAAKTGIYISDNYGEDWMLLQTHGLPLDDVQKLIPLDAPQNQTKGLGHTFIVATKQGAFLYTEQQTTPLFTGMETNDVRWLAYDDRNKVYAATNKGVFYLSVKETLALALKKAQEPQSSRAPELGTGDVGSWGSGTDFCFDQEPTIEDVHAWAINYAEVNQDKITRWRKRANFQALLPTLSAGLDRSEGELRHWDTGTNPDTLIKGKDNLDWDVSVAWNLGELIWNNDQTSIDSRSKLMVELREDILDQVTRIYFERRRLQLELANSNSKIIAEQNLRLEELTALLDGYTGGKFSRASTVACDQWPERRANDS